MITPRQLTPVFKSTLCRMSSTTNYPAASVERAKELAESLREVRAKVDNAMSSSPSYSTGNRKPRLIAVSKYKPAEDIMACYELGQRDFGENYAAELAEKATILLPDIRWHFIGGLQSNKCKPLASIPNIFAVQTVDSIKKAGALQKHLPTERQEPLNIYIQVNTSGEDSKSGLPPLTSATGEVADLALYILKDCPRLRLAGLMTIGSFEASTNTEENKDFKTLSDTRHILEEALRSDSSLPQWGIDGSLELSMGMSADYEAAIQAGSGSVRVGTSIFGSRVSK